MNKHQILQKLDDLLMEVAEGGSSCDFIDQVADLVTEERKTPEPETPRTADGDHRLISVLVRYVPRHVADQIVAEVEDSLWLAERDERV